MKISDMVMNKINTGYVLPSIQREFVWLKNPKEKKVEKLFDSIMQEYPFGVILTWQVQKKSTTDKLHWEVYEFAQHYDSDNPHNKSANINGYTELSLVLDGQQRLTSLFVGLRGSFSYTSHSKKRTAKLFLNLISDIENDPDNTYGLKYEFAFKENPPDDDEHVWFEVGKVLDYRDKNSEIFKITFDSYLKDKISDSDKMITAKINLGQLHKRFCSDDVLHISPFQTEDDEKVLNVFVRTNDGGIKLEKSDLLLSYMESNSKLFQPHGARKEITRFTDEINKEKPSRPNYNIGMDDVLKSGLVLSDLEVQYKLKNFNEDNLVTISKNWADITKYLTLTVDLIAKYGFSEKNIVSNNGLIPIAYYLKKIKADKSFIHSQSKKDIKLKNDIIKWLVISQLTGAFGGSSDTTLKNVRDLINSGKSFSKINLGRVIDRTDVEKWVEKETYLSRYSHLILMLLCDSKYWNDCHQDHIYPKSKFNEDYYKKHKLNKQQRIFYDNNANSIVNLHLLNPSVNIVKSDDDFIDWANSQHKDFYRASLIPKNIDYSFSNFENFITERKKLMVNKIYDILT